MADRLDLAVAALLREVIHAVDRRGGRDAEVVVVEAVETVVRGQCVGLVRDGVPLVFDLLEVPLFVVVDRRRKVDVVEEVERRRDGDRVLDAVLHVFERLLREDFRLGGGHRVGHLARVLHRDLLVPAVLAGLLLAFEGVEARDVEHHRRQRHRDRLVLRVLRDGHVRRERERRAGPVLRVGDRRVGLRGEDVVEVGGRIAAVTAGGEVHRGRERRTRVGLGVLRVGPLDAEVALLDVVVLALFARLDVRILHVETAAVLVALDVARGGRCLPRTERVEAAAHRQVGVFAQREVVAQVAQEESLGVLLAVGRHQQARLGTHVDREEALGDAEEVDRHVLHHQVGRAGDDLLARNYLRLGHRQIEVRVVRLVAGGVFAVLDVDRVVGHLLHAAAHQPAVALLRGHALDLGLLRVEVVGDRVHLVGGRTVGELGLGDDELALHRVGFAVGVDQFRVHVDAHEVGLEVAVLIGDIALVVDVDQLVAHVVDQRVGVLARDRIVEKGARGPRFLDRVAVQRVCGERVGAGHVQRVGFPGDERIDLRREERVALLLRQGVEGGAPPGLFAGLPPCLAPREGLRFVRRRAHGVGGKGSRKGVGHGAVERRAGGRAAQDDLGEQEQNRRRQEIFYPNSIQNPKNFPYLCRQVGKNARNAPQVRSRRILSPTKIGKKIQKAHICNH